VVRVLNFIAKFPASPTGETENLDKNGMKGQITLEIIISLFILVISISTAIIVSFGGQSMTLDTQLSNQALYLSRQGLETYRSLSKQNFNSLTSSSSTQDIYLKEIIVQNIGSSTKKITSRISWKTEPSRPQKIELTTYLTDWKIVPPIGSSCSNGPLTGDWSHPRVLASVDIGSGNQGTDVAVLFPYVYVSSIASQSSKPDLIVFNVSSSTHPTIVKSIDIGSDGINSIFIKGNYLYAASPNVNKELIIFDISNPTSTKEVGSYNVSGSADGLSITVFGNTAALGLAGSSGKEIYFINVANPSSTSFISSYEVGGNVNDFALSNQYLYAVSSDASNDIMTFDITTSSSPLYVSTYNLRDGTEDISVSYQPPGTLFVGNLNNLIVPVDVTDPLHMSAYPNFQTGGSVKDLFCFVGNLTFLATTNSNKEFMIINTANPAAISEYASLNFPQEASGIAFNNNIVYISLRSNDGLRIITSSP